MKFSRQSKCDSYRLPVSRQKAHISKLVIEWNNYKMMPAIPTIIMLTVYRSQWSSSSMSDCSVRGPGIESSCEQLCLSQKTTVIYSLGHGLCAHFLQCLGQLSLQPYVGP